MSRWDADADEIRNPEPYSFAGAKRAIARASRDQAHAMEYREQAASAAADAEKAYRIAKAKAIVEARAEWPATVAVEVANGDRHVSELRAERDVKRGVEEAAQQLAWQASANRRSLEQLVAWSMKIAPDGEFPEGGIR